MKCGVESERMGGDAGWADLLARGATEEIRRSDPNTERVHLVLRRLASDLSELSEFERFAPGAPLAGETVSLNLCTDRLFNAPGDDSFGRCFRVVNPRRIVMGDSASRVALWERRGGPNEWQSEIVAYEQASCIEIAPGGRVFVGTTEGGLASYRRDLHGVFVEESRIQLGSARVLWMRPECDGRVLGFTHEGLFSFCPAEGRVEQLLGALRGRRYSCITAEPEGALLIGTEGGELFRLKRDRRDMQLIGGFSFAVSAIAPLSSGWIVVGGDDRLVVTKGMRELDDMRWGTHVPGELVSLQSLGNNRFCSFADGLLEVWAQGTGHGWFGRIATFYAQRDGFGDQLLCTQTQLLSDGRLFMAGSARYGERIAAAQFVSSAGAYGGGND